MSEPRCPFPTAGFPARQTRRASSPANCLFALLAAGLLAGCAARDQKTDARPGATAKAPPSGQPGATPIGPAGRPVEKRPVEKRAPESERPVRDGAKPVAEKRPAPVPGRPGFDGAFPMPEEHPLRPSKGPTAPVTTPQPAAKVSLAVRSLPKPPLPPKATVKSTPPSPEKPAAKATPPSPEKPIVKAAPPPEKPAVPPAEEPGDHTIVKVFYATDRATVDLSAPRNTAVHDWSYYTLWSAGVSMVLVGLAYRYRLVRRLRWLARLAVAVTIVLACCTVYAGWRDWIAARPGKSLAVAYGPQRGELALGTCEVSIPKDHKVGKLESPSILRFEVRENPARHVVLLATEQQPEEEFDAALRACVGRSEGKEAFVFVHGFNVTFEDAARRTAQIAYDLKFPGAPIFYSWPSQGSLLGYTVDETNVEWTVPHLKQFLLDIAERSGAQQIHLIAHSMGNRALTAALRSISYKARETGPLFHDVVLTAPDIDADIFRRDIVPAIVKTARRVTLYASSSDEALLLSKQFHGYPRAGDTGGNLVVLSGIDTIDVTGVDTSFIGHSYYGSNDSVLSDLFDLLREGRAPDQRKWLRAQVLGQLKYWVFQRE